MVLFYHVETCEPHSSLQANQQIVDQWKRIFRKLDEASYDPVVNAHSDVRSIFLQHDHYRLCHGDS
jgi:ADP-heptose:LPS heptosyltransferase